MYNPDEVKENHWRYNSRLGSWETLKLYWMRNYHSNGQKYLNNIKCPACGKMIGTFDDYDKNNRHLNYNTLLPRRIGDRWAKKHDCGALIVLCASESDIGADS